MRVYPRRSNVSGARIRASEFSSRADPARRGRRHVRARQRIRREEYLLSALIRKLVRTWAYRLHGPRSYLSRSGIRSFSRLSSDLLKILRNPAFSRDRVREGSSFRSGEGRGAVRAWRAPRVDWMRVSHCALPANGKDCSGLPGRSQGDVCRLDENFAEEQSSRRRERVEAQACEAGWRGQGE